MAAGYAQPLLELEAFKPFTVESIANLDARRANRLRETSCLTIKKMLDRMYAKLYICPSDSGDFMVAQERLAAFRLTLVLLMLAVFAALIPVMGASRAQGAFGLFALLAIEPLLFRRKRVGPWDERDRAIHLRSLQISGVIVGLLATAALWTTYYLRQHAGVISVELLPWAAWLGWIGFLFSQSAAVLVLYRLG